MRGSVMRHPNSNNVWVCYLLKRRSQDGKVRCPEGSAPYLAGARLIPIRRMIGTQLALIFPVRIDSLRREEGRHGDGDDG